MRISFYAHAWQAILMFLAGILCVLASFFGYLKSGGGEELLRRALLNISSGKASYQSTDFHWKEGTVEVTRLRHEDFDWPKGKDHIVSLKNLEVPRLTVQFEGFPARVDSITVSGMKIGEEYHPATATINLNEGFLQEGKVPETKPPEKMPRIKFEDCDLNLSVGKGAALTLKHCGGELSRDANGKLRGGFSLKELNGQPFDFTLEVLENGRWVVNGGRIQLDTKGTFKGTINPFESKVDPVGVLIKALFTGEMGAAGTINSLHVAVQPKTEHSDFACEGNIAYSKLSFKLPNASQKAGEVLPLYLSYFLGASEKEAPNLWPRWMVVDQIVTGDNGRLAFHMNGSRLDFACDEGPGSALQGIIEKQGNSGVDRQEFPTIESLKGTVERDAGGAPRRVLLRGFFGDLLSFETRFERGENNARTYELWIEPRPGDSARYRFERPLWRFESRATDYFSVQSRPADLPLAEFEVEAACHGFPEPKWLPPGLTMLGGRFFAKGKLYNGDEKDTLALRLDNVRIYDGGKLAFGKRGANAERVPAEDFHPFWEAFYALCATDKPWSINDLDASGEVAVQIGSNRVTSLSLSRWNFASGVLSHDGTLTNFALPELRLSGEYKQTPGDEKKSARFALKGGDWSAELEGEWTHNKGSPPRGEFSLRELSVPLSLHPQRDRLKQNPIYANGVTRLTKITVSPGEAHVESTEK